MVCFTGNTTDIGSYNKGFIARSMCFTVSLGKAVVKVLMVDQKQMIIKILDTVSMKLGFSLAGIRKWFMSTFLSVLRILMNLRPERGLYNE